MGKTQKKTGKGRLDKYYKLAKEQGYRARSAFKLIQLNKKYGFLESARCCIDLCAAPGGWLQVASKTMPLNSLIVGVDLVPIRPIPRVVTFAQDITTSACRAQLRNELKDWKADVVLHDGAPNVGTAWVQDAYSQSELVLMSLKLAVEFLSPGGTFVTKVFRSVDYNNLIWVFNQLFGKVEATKPPSSRNVSAEIFVVCQGYLAPQHIDPKFLDPRHVFKDVTALPPVPSTSTAQPGSKAHNSVFQPEKKRRARDGYADGDYTLFHAVGASEFVHSHDPVTVLGSSNQITFKADEEKEWLKHELTTPDVLANCEDLKIGLETKNKPVDDATETVEITEEVDEDQQIEDELHKLTTESAARAKRDRRRANEKRTRTVIRMQLQMTAPLDIGMDFKDDALKGDVFDLGEADGRRVDDESDSESEPEKKEENVGGEKLEEDDSEDDRLEDELDGLYDQYRERLAERDLKFKAKEAKRKDQSREEWGGIKKDEDGSEDEDSDEGEGGWDATLAAKDDGEESSSDEEDDEPVAIKKQKTDQGTKLITKLEEPKVKASKAAQVWFSQDLFKGMADAVEDEDEDEQEDESEEEEDATPDDEDEDDFEIVPQSLEDDTPMWDVDNEDEDEAKQAYIQSKSNPFALFTHPNQSSLEYGLLTPEAQTLAHKLVNRQTTKTHLLNDGFTRYSLNDQNDLPTWFLDDERKHYKPNIPITKEAIAALRAKQRALDARPIKKVAEAKARKKLRAQQRLEKALKKAEGVNEMGDMTEKEKAAQIEKLMNKGMSKGKKKKEVKVVVAKGVHKGIKGRPKGVKGRYAMVDARMRKEMRAKKRKEKANKKRKRA
ncbi:unnamed protein product [Rhizoctonia solani]|uniref:AdoMet-dependent rRNA methyltransferase SPB1 n=1 Tax=Rhizoctonia solani TaxID=456999 RepID=A0A8H3AU07_9AGAM|nr:unnamed protein product [Rhizoctonia solani]